MSTTVRTGYEDLYTMNYENTYLKPWHPTNAVSKEDNALADELSGKKADKKEKTNSKKEPSRFKSFIKGAANFFKGLVCDKDGKFSLGQTLKTVGIGLLVAGASVLIPGAGTAIAIAGLGYAGVHMGKAAIDIYNAEGADEINAAYEQLGSAATESVLAYAGAKGTNAFGTLKNAGKAAKSAGSDLVSSYKAGGLKGLSTEVKAQKATAWDAIKDAKKSTIDGTKANIKNMTNAKAKYDSKMKSYDEQIKNAKTPEAKAKLRAEKQNYKNGYNKVATETDYSKAYDALRQMEEQVANAKKAATKNGASDAAKAKYRKLSEEYSAASKTLETRVQNGEFKATTKAGKTSKRETAKAEKATKNAYDEMIAKRDALRKATKEADIKKAQKEYDEAAKVYAKAVKAEEAIKGETSKVYIAKEAISEGIQQRPVQWMTVTMAGRGRQDSEYEYVA